jgi:hypothetical protein
VPNLPRLEDIETDGSIIPVTTVAIIETVIPIIIRRGKPDAKIWFGDVELALDGNKPLLHTSLFRVGERSVYGDLQVDYYSESGKKTELAILRGVGVYHPTPVRHLQLPLKLPENLVMSSGRINVSFRETEAGHGDLEAVTELVVE